MASLKKAYRKFSNNKPPLWFAWARRKAKIAWHRKLAGMAAEARQELILGRQAIMEGRLPHPQDKIGIEAERVLDVGTYTVVGSAMGGLAMGQRPLAVAAGFLAGWLGIQGLVRTVFKKQYLNAKAIRHLNQILKSEKLLFPGKNRFLAPWQKTHNRKVIQKIMDALQQIENEESGHAGLLEKGSGI